MAEAKSLEAGDLASAEAEALKEAGSDPAAPGRVDALKGEWQRQVISAVATAEIVVPLLAERIAARAVETAGPAAVPVADRRSKVEASESSIDIADFIEDMLAQEGVGSR